MGKGVRPYEGRKSEWGKILRKCMVKERKWGI